ncbi:MAG: hypothetical protein IJD04_06680 [Desulfovibrionaceae bacterium]|nr:hypothetical protein [Desulfovibrionaceae bacterium]
MRISLISVTIILAVGFSACTQTTKDYWKTTKSYYYEYVNKPASVDLEDMGIYSPGEGYLAETVPPVERTLERFKRTLFSLGKAPADNWMYAFVQRFPWIEGVALIDTHGTVIHKWPSVSLKEYSYGFIAEDTANPELRHLIGHAEETPLGPHVYVATQIMEMAQPAGHFVVHFDPRALFAHVRGAEEFMVAAPNALLWPGMFEVSATPVAGADWAELTRSSLSGRVYNENGGFVWYCIMVGTLPMVFAAPDEGSFPEAPGQLSMLSAFRGADGGEVVGMAVMTDAPEHEPGVEGVLAPPVADDAGSAFSEDNADEMRSEETLEE